MGDTTTATDTVTLIQEDTTDRMGVTVKLYGEVYWFTYLED